MSRIELSTDRSNVAHNRWGYIDVCKAIGIFLVVLGHTPYIPHSLYIAIFSFHMPLFFIMMGFVYNHQKYCKITVYEFVKRKAKQYLLPYFLFAIINLLIQVIWRLLISHQTVDCNYILINLKGILLCYDNKEYMPNCIPIWFLCCAFFASVLFWIIMKIRIRYAGIIIVGLMVVYFLIIPYYIDQTTFVWKFPTMLMAAFYMFIGYILKLGLTRFNRFFENNTSTVAIIVLVVVSLYLVVVTNSRVNMDKCIYSNTFLSLPVSVVVSSGIIAFLKKITILELPFVKWIGKNTIYFIGFNYLCIDIALIVCNRIPGLNYKENWGIVFVITFIICLVFAFIGERIRKSVREIALLKRKRKKR